MSWRRSAAARAAQGRGRASCRLRLAASPSSPRSPTSPARCPSVTTARARTAAKKRYACPPTRLKMLHGHTQACVSSVPVKQHEMARNVHVPFTVRQTPPRAASSQTATRTRCQRGASSALVAETAVRTLSGIGVLGRVPSGSRGGRVLSACIIFFVSWGSYGCNEPKGNRRNRRRNRPKKAVFVTDTQTHRHTHSFLSSELGIPLPWPTRILSYLINSTRSS